MLRQQLAQRTSHCNAVKTHIPIQLDSNDRPKDFNSRFDTQQTEPSEKSPNHFNASTIFDRSNSFNGIGNGSKQGLQCHFDRNVKQPNRLSAPAASAGLLYEFVESISSEPPHIWEIAEANYYSPSDTPGEIRERRVASKSPSRPATYLTVLS